MLQQEHDERNLETIPVGTLGIIAMKGCTDSSIVIDAYLKKWRTTRKHDHENDISFKGYVRESYLIPTSTIPNPLDNTLRFSLLFDFSVFQADGGE